jgi:hypothetical protein
MMNERGTTDFQDLRVGAEVYTSDGDKIGEVREVQQGSFKVNAAMQPDYWLSIHTVASTDGNRVTLGFDKNGIGDYKSSEPLAA